ncbi:hypothetical protein TVAG_382490 [Trichomonas vaginalis G3]|uniref:Uncharacterized protein n=1 Tax=Trichomonas vaginalis (strain ATCC PRA-98 / G3) TaxID=412133 RepID=A2FBS5_TRIV3|nr:hypothetical protein TVAGG3_0642940 [Trichomonas vaginalis G3]EAX97625.1 hypothetical protein TVAG_382490 [Trichomonas vaginalis G3]KAI5505302.1 hypothetical protein TVAGG3_0642940 [Trichomonas vaginalis G3]|eukprot:XP_001310555.1 hypothetical protein [Trichomonas vaginalis G3]
MTTSSSLISVVTIHLTIHRDNVDLKIDFPFDTRTDNIDEIVSELAKECSLSDPEREEVKNLIQTQIIKAQNGANMSIPKVDSFDNVTSEPDLLDSSDDEIINDPEYQALLERQRKEIAAMEENHLKQQRALVNGNLTPSSTPKTCDDLIVFS